MCQSGKRFISSSGGLQPCPLFPLRYGTKPNERSLEGWEGGLPLRPLQAVRERCLNCAPELAFHGLCGIETCPLYPFRMGKNPSRAGKGGKGNFGGLLRARLNRQDIDSRGDSEAILIGAGVQHPLGEIGPGTERESELGRGVAVS